MTIIYDDNHIVKARLKSYYILCMAKRGRKKKSEEITVKSDETKLFVGLVLAIIGLIVFFAPFFDAEAFRYILNLLGLSSILWGSAIIYLSLRFFTSKESLTSWKTLAGLTLLALVISTFLLFWTPKELLTADSDFTTTGGLLGFNIHISLMTAVGTFIEFIILLVAMTISISLITGVKMSQIRDFFTNLLIKDEEADINIENIQSEIDISASSEAPGEEARMNGLFDQQDTISEMESTVESVVETEDSSQPVSRDDQLDDDGDLGQDGPRFQNWTLPATDLLQEPVIRAQNKEVYKKNALVIEQTLRSFGVQAKVVEVSVGPTVVQYALSISVGTKVAKVRNLANDLALALAAPSSTVRIEAPIPGTSLVGVEAPNPTPNFVYAREVINKLKQETDKYELPLVLGKDVSGKVIIHDLAKLPHLLVAGATGTGKSVGINSILLGLLMTKSPDEVRFILVDPKTVEMVPYDGIPHLLTPVITDMDLVVNSLQWATEEMARRYRILKQVGVRKITEYNQKLGYTAMPYIVIVIDEMADLMLSAGVDVETRIVRLAQMSRAVGIHLILATQRPSVNVITGLIKANVPGRIAFSVTTAIDSRVIIDQVGAESLLGNGDMLFKSPEKPKPIRVQGTYTDIKDLDKVIKIIRDQTGGKVEYPNEVTKPQQSDAQKVSGGVSNDPLFRDAVEIIVNAQKGSVSLLQRRLEIGFNRASKLVEQMEEAGIVSPAEGSKPRKVLITSTSQFFGDSSD